MDERQQIEQAIAALEAQRAILGNQVVETALAPLRQKLAALQRTAAPVMEGERRQVTVLFADLSGFTTLAERLDPEQVRDLINACFEHLGQVITRYEGTVGTFIGDEVMALFGAPVAHENDPERAVRAALDMMTAIEDFNKAHHTELGIHIGINTGLVVAGDIGTRGRRQYTVMGDAVNLAARLADLAPRGQIFVGNDTYRLTAPQFEFEVLEPVHVQGKSEAVAAYRVLRIRPAVGRVPSIGGVCPLLVGRDAECATLSRCLERLLAGHGQIVSVIGEAGIGKSRLMAEMRRAFATEALTWIEGRSVSYGSALAYLPFLEVLRTAMGAARDDTPLTLRERLRKRVADLFPQRFAEVYPYLGRLLAVPLEVEFETQLGYLDGESLKWQTLRVVGDLLTHLAQERPLVLVLEDLHWADPSSIELLEYLLPFTEKAPLMIVAVFRPQENAACRRIQHKAAQEFPHRYTEIQLRALSLQESEQLMDQLLVAQDLPAPLRNQILDRAEGNPLFVEEIVRSLIESGVVVQQEGRWRVVTPVDEIAVPTTLQGVLMARIDRLEEDTRRVLQLASVIGRIFMVRLLAAISDMDHRGLERHLGTLQRLELIRERSRTPEIEYIFKHTLIQETAYHSLLLQRRREIHRRIGECIEELFAGRLEEHYGLLAHHYSQAEDHQRALYYLMAAGDQARLAHAHEEALDFYRRALAVQRELGDEEGMARTLLKQGLVYQLLFDFEHACASFEKSFALWQRIRPTYAGLPPAPHPLRTILGSEPATLDPGLANDSVSLFVSHQLFEGLVQFDAELNVMPAMAYRWEILEGGVRYLFHLREDMCWSDGSPLTAHDFEYAWRRNLDPACGADYAVLLYDIRGARAWHQGHETDPQRLGIRALDDRTLEVWLEEPSRSFLSILATPIACPLPRAAIAAYGKDWATAGRMVCNGPYYLSEWNAGQSLTLTRNPHYHGDFPGNIEQIHFTILRGPITQGLDLYRSDQLEVGCVFNPMLDIKYSPEIDLDQMRSLYPHELHSCISLVTHYLGFANDRPPFDDVRVRRALAHALDRERLAKLSKGVVLPAWGGFVPPGMAGHSPAIALRYDPDLARRLLAEAGYPGGRGFPPLVMTAAVMIGELQQDLCDQWRETLGIHIQPELIGIRAFVERIARSSPPLYSIGWLADYPSADSFLRVAKEVGLIARGWSDPRYNQLVSVAPRLTDRREHMEAYHQADRILIEEAVVVPLWYEQLHLLVKPWVQGLRASPLGLIRYKEVRIEPH